jgi:hypothetical protein
MNIDKFAEMRALQETITSSNQEFFDACLKGPEGDSIRSELNLKRIQFDTLPHLYERLEQVCALLDCSKRVFLEMVISEGITTAEQSFHETFEREMGREYGVSE